MTTVIPEDVYVEAEYVRVEGFRCAVELAYWAGFRAAFLEAKSPIWNIAPEPPAEGQSRWMWLL